MRGATPIGVGLDELLDLNATLTERIMLMAIELNITAEDVETLVKDSLIKAGLGKVISDSVAKALSGYDSPVEKAIKQYMGEVAATLIRVKFADQITDAVRTAIEVKVTAEMIDMTVNTAVEKMARAAEDRY